MLGLLTIMSCQKQGKGATDNKTKSDTAVTEKADSNITALSDTADADDTEPLPFIEERFMSLANQLYDIQVNHDEWEVKNKKKEEIFTRAFTRALVAFYNKQNKDKKLSDSQKAALMLKEFKAGFHPYEATTTLDMSIAGCLRYGIARYEVNTLTAQLVQKNPDLQSEINAWNHLYESLASFVSSVSYRWWFGGSGAGVASISGSIRLKEARLADLRAMEKGRKGKDKGTKTKNVSEKDFLKAMEKASGDLSEDKEYSETLSGEQLKEYRNLLKSIKKDKQQLPQRLSEWLKQRRQLKLNNTKTLLDKLTKAILDTDPHGHNYEE